MQERYYVHGDACEGVEGEYYCKKCDSFERPCHFDEDSHTKSRADRYRSSLAGWLDRCHEEETAFRRPTNPANVIAALAKEDDEGHEKSKSKFFRWLEKQIQRDDIVGDLAQDVLRDKAFPITEDSLDILRAHLMARRACSAAIVALDEGWGEYLRKAKSRMPIAPKVRFGVFKRDEYRCCICGITASEGARLEIDHKVPLAKGGGDDEINLWTLCFDCNRGKGKLDL